MRKRVEAARIEIGHEVRTSRGAISAPELMTMRRVATPKEDLLLIGGKVSRSRWGKARINVFYAIGSLGRAISAKELPVKGGGRILSRIVRPEICEVIQTRERKRA